MFSSDEVKSMVQSALNEGMVDIPDGRHFAILSHLDGDKANFVFAQKLGDYWTAQEVVEKGKGKHLSFGVNLQASW